MASGTVKWFNATKATDSFKRQAAGRTFSSTFRQSRKLVCPPSPRGPADPIRGGCKQRKDLRRESKGEVKAHDLLAVSVARLPARSNVCDVVGPARGYNRD